MKHLLITIAALVLVGCGTTQQPEPQTAKAPDISIHQATKEGNIEAVKQHLAAGTDVNAKDTESVFVEVKGTPLHFEGTPLHFAANNGHKEIAKLLITNDADVNAKEEEEG